MSIRFNGNVANFLSRTSSLPNYNSQYTIMCWFKIVVDTDATATLFNLATSAALNFDRAKLDNNGTLLGVSARNPSTVVTDDGTDLTVGLWRHITMRRASVSDLKVFLDAIEDASSNFNATGRTVNDNMEIGRAHVNGLTIEPINGETAYLRIWTTDLTPAEMVIERISPVAVKTSGLYGDYPMFNSATAGNDVSGNGNHFTVNGTVATGDSNPGIVTGPSLFRGRLFTFFDDEEVNRFEFWPAASVGGETIITPATATLTLSNFAPALALGFVPATTNLVLLEFAPILELKAIPPTATLTLSSLTPALSLGVIPSTDGLVLSEFAPALELKIIPSTLALTTSSFPSAVRFDVIPGTTSLTLNTLAPGLEIRVVPNTTTLILNAFAPAIKTVIAPGTAALTTSTLAPALSLSLTPQTAGLSLTTFASTLSLALIPQTTSLTLTTFAPSLSGEISVIPASATLNITTFAVRLSETTTPITAGLTLTGLTPQLATQVIPSTQALVSTLFIPRLHTKFIIETVSLTITPFAPIVIAGGEVATIIIPSTRALFLNRLTSNVLAFHVRSDLSVDREVQTVRVAKENRVLNVSQRTNRNP